LAKYEGAISLLERALAILETIAQRSKNALTVNLEATLATVRCLTELATNYHLLDQRDVAGKYYEEALTYFNTKSGGVLHPDGAGEEGHLYRKLLNNKACNLNEMGHSKEAVEIHQMLLESRRQVGNNDETAQSLTNLGLASEMTGDYDNALVCYKEAHMLLTRHFGEGTCKPADVALNMGLVYHRKFQEDAAGSNERKGNPEDLSKAIEIFDDAITLYANILGAKHCQTNYAKHIRGNSLILKATIIHAEEPDIREALLIGLWNNGATILKSFESTYNGPHLNVAQTLHMLYVTSSHLVKEELKRDKEVKALRERKDLTEEEISEIKQKHVVLKGLRLKVKGIEFMERSMAVYEALHYNEHHHLKMVSINEQLGSALHKAKKYLRASECYTKAANLTNALHKKSTADEAARRFRAAVYLKKAEEDDQHLITVCRSGLQCLNELEPDDIQNLLVPCRSHKTIGTEALVDMRYSFHEYVAMSLQNEELYAESYQEYEKILGIFALKEAEQLAADDRLSVMRDAVHSASQIEIGEEPELVTRALALAVQLEGDEEDIELKAKPDLLKLEIETSLDA